MKVAASQRSILSFFGPPKASQDGISNSREKKSVKNSTSDDSPIKKVKKKSRVIQSDSEDEQEEKIQPEQSCENEEISITNEEPHDDSLANPSTSAKKIGFSAETVPPLRKTARKQMKRNSDALEDHQIEVVKKLKSSPSAASPVSKTSGSKGKAGKTKVNDHKRTNCLDKFVFIKTQRTSNTESDETEELKSNSESSSANTKELKSNSESLLTNTKNHSKNTPDKNSSSEVKHEEMEVESSESSSVNTQENDSENIPDKNSTSQVKHEEMEVESSSDSPSKNVSDSNSPLQEKDTSDQNKNTSNEKSPQKSKSIHENSPRNSPTGDGGSESRNKSDTKAKKNLFSITKQNKAESKSYDPSKARYDPLEDASWKRNEDVPFSALSKTFELIEDTSGRLKIIEILANFLRSVIILSPDDLLYCIYLCLNKVAPSFEGIELGVGEIYVCRAVAQVTGRAVNMIKNEISEKGDLGLVAEHSKTNQRMMFEPAPLTVKKVFKNLKEIALMSGQASQNKKIDKIKSMFVACKGSEARFLIRFCGGKLRIGLAEQSALQAVAQACFLTPPGKSFPPEISNAGKGLSAENLKTKVDEYANILKTTYCECPTFDSIVPVLLDKGMKELPNFCKLEPGIPLKPMLAHPTKGVSEVLKRFEKSKFTCEYKYDGERAQIHLKEDGTVSIFSRNQENNTSKYPDIIIRLKDSLGSDVKSCVLDSEAVAYDVAEKKILPFQILSTRKRKDANESEIKVQVCLFPFDLLYLNGQNLITEPLQVRRDLLRANFIEKESQFTFAKSIDSTNTEDIEEFLEESIKGNCEGLMVKSLDVDATYEIAKRSRNWLKLKKDYLEGVGDTIDVVVIGGFFGKGKRTGTYGGFLLACHDPDNEEFQSLCKIGTGFSDDDLQTHTSFLKEHVIENPKSYYRFDSSVTPDHWFDAVQVWEIKCADLSVSPVHKAAIGIVDREKGISLRFPRFLRIRDDKSPEDATSASQIADLYRNQDQIKNQTETNKDEDFY